MKFKEKDPIVSMEQWFPGVVIEDVKEVEAKTRMVVSYEVNEKDLEDLGYFYSTISDSHGEYGPNIVGALVKQKVYDKTHPNGYLEYMHTKNDPQTGTSFGILVLRPSDYVLTYQSGRREVLTNKEKEERFE